MHHEHDLTEVQTESNPEENTTRVESENLHQKLDLPYEEDGTYLEEQKTTYVEKELQHDEIDSNLAEPVHLTEDSVPTQLESVNLEEKRTSTPDNTERSEEHT